jgi:hypothetical protein
MQTQDVLVKYIIYFTKEMQSVCVCVWVTYITIK